MSDDGGGGAAGGRGGIARSLRRFQQRVEPTAVRVLLLVVFVTGLTAQFVTPLGDALEGKAFLGGALLSLVAFVLYDALKELTAASRLPARVEASSRNLGNFVADAFESRRVEISFYGYTGETLFNELYHRLERLAEAPGPTRRVTVRMIVPDFSLPMFVPSRVGADGTAEDAPEFRDRIERKCQEYDQILSHLAEGLTRLGHVEVHCEYRVVAGPPLHKLCIFNRKRVLHGLYDLSSRMSLRTQYYDPKGYDTDLTVLAAERRPEDEPAVGMWVKHFDDLWALVAQVPEWRRRAAA
ncbi:hypothetical protein ACFV9W_28800 [Streptomyces sp. NPDC059897]|uniref:hypothetical protein n=1 Tax=Streptomyces sp. NPDC059897 TaxID=3346994 RepID=UPI003668E78A